MGAPREVGNPGASARRQAQKGIEHRAMEAAVEESIAQIAPGLPVVVMSGSCPTLPTGTAFVAKPFSIGHVGAAITAAIDGPGTCRR